MLKKKNFDAFYTLIRILSKVHACSWRLFLENHGHFHLQDVIQPLFQGTLQRDEKERALSLCTAAFHPPPPPPLHSNEVGRHSESTANCRLKRPTLIFMYQNEFDLLWRFAVFLEALFKISKCKRILIVFTILKQKKRIMLLVRKRSTFRRLKWRPKLWASYLNEVWLKALSIFQNWPAGLWPDRSFWQWNRPFRQEFLMKTHFLRAYYLRSR